MLEAAGVRGGHDVRAGGAAVDVRFVYGDKRRSDTGGKRRESSEALLEKNGWPILYCRGAGHRMHWDEGRGLSLWHPLPLSCPSCACLLSPPPLSLLPWCVSLQSCMRHPLSQPLFHPPSSSLSLFAFLSGPPCLQIIFGSSFAWRSWSTTLVRSTLHGPLSWKRCMQTRAASTVVSW